MRLVVVLAIVFGVSSSAQAYHLAGDFEETATKGGGGGIWFTGSPRWNNYDCSACHTDAAREISFELSSESSELFDMGLYRAGQTYEIRVELIGEHAGLEAKSNINLIGLEALDSKGEPAGRFVYDEEDMVQPVDDLGVLFSQPGQDLERWEFAWIAPPLGSGVVSFHLAGVDGNGNNVLAVDDGDGSDAPGSDPRGDDVATITMQLHESGGVIANEELGDVRGGCSATGQNRSGWLVWLVLALVPLRRRD